jgi:tetratricopeptide (TPR) repeat protein
VTLIAALVITGPFTPQQAVALTTAEIVAKAKPAVVAIERIDTINNLASQGTGWFCGDGKTVVTNAHVLKGTYNVLKVYNVATGKEYTIDHVNYFNPKDDVAALTVREENNAFLAISDIAPVEGSNVTVIGNPKGLYGTVTTGIVSALRTEPKAGSMMQISAPVSHGSSGSPVLNDNGQVIGMVWGGDPQNDAHDLNYAVPQGILKSDLFGISVFNIGGPLTFATLPSAQTITAVTATPTPGVDANTLVENGNAFVNKKEYDKAISAFTEAIRLNPIFSAAYYDRGCAYDDQGKYAMAISDYTEAIQLDPNFTFAYYNRGNVYESQGKYAMAISDYNEAIRLDPNYGPAYLNRGIAYRDQGNYAMAISDYNEAIRLDPNYALAYKNRGNAYLRVRKRRKADADFAMAERLNGPQ